MNSVLSRLKPGIPAVLFMVAVFSAALLARAPASLIPAFFQFENNGAGYTDVRGTIWKGHFSDLTVNGISFGDLHYRFSPVSLLTFSPGFSVRMSGGHVQGAAFLQAYVSGRVEITDMKAGVYPDDIVPYTFMGYSPSGVVRLDADRIVFRDGRCAGGGGNVWTDILDAPARRFFDMPLPLEGVFGCTDGVLSVTMEGRFDNEHVNTVISVFPDFKYEITTAVRTQNDMLSAALLLSGFEDDDDVLVYGMTGILRGMRK